MLDDQKKGVLLREGTDEAAHKVGRHSGLMVTGIPENPYSIHVLKSF